MHSNWIPIKLSFMQPTVVLVGYLFVYLSKWSLMAPLKNFTSHNIYHLTCGWMDGWIANSGSKYFNLIMIARDSS